jgi:hypothetical protein
VQQTKTHNAESGNAESRIAPEVKQISKQISKRTSKQIGQVPAKLRRRSRMARWGAVLFGASLAQLASAHQQPTTLAVLNVASDRVELNLHLPLSELELAFGHKVTERPMETMETMAEWDQPLRDYVVSHIRPVGIDGRRWSVQPLDISLAKSEQAQSGPFQEVNVRLMLLPPPGESARHFRLLYDVIMHQVVTHKAVFSVRNDWASGRAGETRVGVVSVDTGTSRIEPLEIDLGEGSLWKGFLGTVRLGMQHIRDGLDHLLFLIVLLLPAMLTVRNGAWAQPSDAERSLVRLARIVSAFTLGHSATLAAGALHWFRLPQGPVEVLIAFSILVTAIHAIRPMFPGREAHIAAGFGLVHGLAFASAISDLHLPAGPLVLSIFGFNLGIELMQLFVIGLTIPWLILLSRTRVYGWVRVGGASLAAVASIGWMVNRISGEPNVIENWTGTATRLAPLGIVLLALIAIPAYFYPALKTPHVYIERETQS